MQQGFRDSRPRLQWQVPTGPARPGGSSGEVGVWRILVVQLYMVDEVKTEGQDQLGSNNID